MHPTMQPHRFAPLIGLFTGALALTWMIVIAPPLFSKTEADDAPVLLHPAAQEYPAVDGERAVWQDGRNGPTDIFMADLRAGTIVNLTETDGRWEVQPAIAGDFVVWKDGYQGIGIHGLNLRSGERFTVTSGHSDVSRPRLSGQTVVWADNRAGNADWNIYGFDLTARHEFVISDAPGGQGDPQIDGHLVVWWDHAERILLYDLTTQQTITAHGASGARLPAVSVADQLVVWQDIRNGDWDIYGYDLTTQSQRPLVVAPGDQEMVAIADGLVTFRSRLPGTAGEIWVFALASGLSFPVTANSSVESFPDVSGPIVVWQDSRNHSHDIYRYWWDGVVPAPAPYPLPAPLYLEVGSLPAGRLVVRWQDSAENEAGFLLERATGIVGADWVAYAHLPPNSEVFTDTPGVHGESYWYRVRAYNREGFSPYSNEAFNTTFDDTPNVFEQYLMVLVNEVRADPAHFGYEDYPPAPPLTYNPLLAYSARAHSQAILNAAYQFGHCDPVGRCSRERAEAVGYTGAVYCADNLIRSHNTLSSIEEAHQVFLHSPGHRDTMLHPHYTEFAAGHVYDPAKGDQRTQGNLTEVFCRRDEVARPAIPSGVVVPDHGPSTVSYTYAVNYYAADGRTPQSVEVVISGKPYAMTLSTGRAAHGAYRYVTWLPTGDHHNYYFRIVEADGAEARWPAHGAVRAPQVYDPANPFTPTPTFTVAPPRATTGAPAETPPPTVTATPSLVPTAAPGEPHLFLPLVAGAAAPVD